MTSRGQEKPNAECNKGLCPRGYRDVRISFCFVAVVLLHKPFGCKCVPGLRAEILGAPSTLYSYGTTQHRLVKFTMRGGVGLPISRVVDPPRHYELTFVALVMLPKEIKMTDLGDGNIQAPRK